nr:hypothetical protein [Myxococcota bacterium]
GGFLAVGAAELAWIWLVPAVLAALAPRLGRLRLVAVAGALLPALLVLDPDQLREAAWNGFAPASVPLVVWLAVTLVPVLAMATWYVRHGFHSGPLGTLVLPMGWALATALGILMLARETPACTAVQFHAFHLACETTDDVR